MIGTAALFHPPATIEYDGFDLFEELEFEKDWSVFRISMARVMRRTDPQPTKRSSHR